VKKPHNFVNDDEDDSVLFTKMQDYVLENCPNPQRLGCLDHETLRRFVMAPEKLDLSDPKYLHIVKCAECTRELIGLRQLREAALEQESPRPEHKHSRSFLRPTSRVLLTLALSACIVAIISFLMWKRFSTPEAPSADQGSVIAMTVDLSDAGATRSVEPSSTMPAISLPRRRVALHLILPYYSPQGGYRVSVTSAREPNRVEAEASASAVAHGPRTELTVDLDLRRVGKEDLALNTYCIADSSTSSYALTIK
jgi:hypothetical protein